MGKWKLVQREPTEAMIEAAGGEDVNLERADDPSYRPRDVWADMLAASPSPVEDEALSELVWRALYTYGVMYSHDIAPDLSHVNKRWRIYRFADMPEEGPPTVFVAEFDNERDAESAKNKMNVRAVLAALEGEGNV